MGTEFTLNVFKGVNEMVHAVFEAVLALYDPDIDGYLEEVEKDLDKIVLTKTVSGQAYYVLLVLSRVMNKDKDKDLRFKAQALANVSPQDFGVDRYLLLNEQTPLVEMVESQTEDFERMNLLVQRRSTMGSQGPANNLSSTQNNTTNLESSVDYIFQANDRSISLADARGDSSKKHRSESLANGTNSTTNFNQQQQAIIEDPVGEQRESKDTFVELKITVEAN